VAQIEHFHQMLNRLARIFRLRVGLSEELMSLDLLFTITRLFADVEELLTVLNGAIELSLRLINHTDLLVALGLDVAVLGALGHIQALLEELQGHVKFVMLQVLVCNHLVHSN